MLSCFDLYKQSTHLAINKISLELLSTYYEAFLMPFIFNYELNNPAPGVNNTIRVFFNAESFCHLLGIETIVSKSVRHRDLHSYKGLDGWNNIKDKTITIQHLKTINKSKFNSEKDKYVFFYLIPHLVESPSCILYDKTKVPNSNVDCTIMFHNIMNNARIHLGLEYNVDNDYFVPRTFLIERLTPQNDGNKFIENQYTITARYKHKTIMI